jgi:hypothetical protein
VREISGRGRTTEYEDVVVRLDRVSADEVAAQARELGFLAEPHAFIPETDEYLGSTVVMLRSP